MMYRFYQVLSITNPGLPEQDLTSGTIQSVLGYVWKVAGGIAVIIILLASMKYILSRGDPQAIKSAKETIIYAVVGLLITISGFAITTFIFGRLT